MGVSSPKPNGEKAMNHYWDFPDPRLSATPDRVRYLCWRACGESEDEAWSLALRGVMPANWAFTQEP